MAAKVMYELAKVRQVCFSAFFDSVISPCRPLAFEESTFAGKTKEIEDYSTKGTVPGMPVQHDSLEACIDAYLSQK